MSGERRVTRFSFKTVPQDTAWEPMRDVWLAADDIEVYRAGWNFDHFYPILQHERPAAGVAGARPAPGPRPPIVIGGGGEKRTLRIAARYADQWNAPGATPEVLRHKIDVLHGHCADVGRDPAEIEISVQVRTGAT